MKLLIQQLVALFFATILLAACGNKEEAMSPESAPAEEAAASAPAPAAAEPAQEEPGGWVPPAE